MGRLVTEMIMQRVFLKKTGDSARAEACDDPPPAPPCWCRTGERHTRGIKTLCITGCNCRGKCPPKCDRCHDPRCRALANDKPLQTKTVASNLFFFTSCRSMSNACVSDDLSHCALRISYVQLEMAMFRVDCWGIFSR